MPGLIAVPLELRQMILERATRLDEIDLCIGHAFMGCWSPKGPRALLPSERPENPQLPLHLICKTLKRDLDSIDLGKLNLKCCCSGAVRWHFKDRQTHILARIQTIKFATIHSMAVARDKTGLDHREWVFWLGKWLGSPVDIEVLGTGGWEQEYLVSVVARLDRA